MANPSARCLASVLLTFLLLSSAGPIAAQEATGSTTGSQSAATENGSTGVPGALHGEAALGATAPPESTSPKKPSAREKSLAGVLAARRQIEADLLDRQRELVSDAALGRNAEIEGEIRMLAEEAAELARNFSELAAGVDPDSIELNPGALELNLANEVRDLLGPLVNELKRATSRPREIDRLRTEISELRERLGKVRMALERLARIEETLVGAEVIAAFKAEQHDWLRHKNSISTSLQVAQQKLDLRLGESQSITQAVENLFQLFFKSRGRNLLLALVAMVGFLLGIRRLRAFLAKRPALSQRAESFEGRVFGLIYSVFTVVGAVLVFLISLYFFGDWVLLILVLLLILGLIWTSKQAIPRFWTQTVLILDMGAVREGERVLYKGLPWRVKSISFYTILTNPALVGGTLRLPIDDLSELRSRAYDESEPWFPTETGDIVLMPDGRPAEVEFQSIENVRLRNPGGSRMIMPAAEFAAQTLERLNGGYRVDISFGLDYGDQAEITTAMRETMERGVDARWRTSHWADALISTSVEFQEAGASSLDYYVRVDLDGSCAFDYQAQARQLARFCVDICNEQGWVIPFTQLTLHMADSAKQSSNASEASGESTAYTSDFTPDILPTTD
jgi:hypothetical protein